MNFLVINSGHHDLEWVGELFMVTNAGGYQLNTHSQRNIVMRCPDYDDPTKIIDETMEEYLCEYCCMRGKECDGKGKIILECGECGVVGQALFVFELESRGWEFIEADNGFIEWTYWLCPSCKRLQ